MSEQARVPQRDEQRDAVAAALHSPVQPECYRHDPQDCDACQERASIAIKVLRERDELKSATTPRQILVAGGGLLSLLFVASDIADRKFHLAAMSAAAGLCWIYAGHFSEQPRHVRRSLRVLVPALVMAAVALVLGIWPV
jgi:hypothetical protein